MMVFLLKVSLVLLVLQIFYLLFLEKESFFAVNRIYLMASLVVAFVLPFVTIPKVMENQGIVGDLLPTTAKQRTVVPFDNALSAAGDVLLDTGASSTAARDVQNSTERTRDLVYWLGLLYFFGVVVLALKLISQMIGLLFRIQRHQDRIEDGPAIILNTPAPTEPCSFFNYIFIHPASYDSATYEQILEHEKIHIRKRHSLDLLLSEITIVLLWFNPMVWLYRKQVEKNLEYQTDAILLDCPTVASEEYQMKLLEIATQRRPLALVSNYNQSLIKKRILMMNRKKSNNNSYWKYAFMAPVLFATLVLLNQPAVLNAQEGDAGVSDESENVYENEYNDEAHDLPPLLWAARRGDEKMVRKLLEEGADVNEFVHGDGTALLQSIAHGHMEIAALLLEHGAGPELGSRADGHPLWMAARRGDLKMVRLLVERGVDINQKFPGDGSALIQACRRENLEFVKALVAMGADVNMAVRGDGNPLIMASKGGHIDLVKYLVAEGAEVNTEVKGDETPLINASEQGNLDVVKYLIAQGAEVNKVCREELSSGKIRTRTALKMAQRKGHDEVVRYLREKGAVPQE